VRLAGIAVTLALAACGGKRDASGPAWPKSAGWDLPEDWKEDGGESIDPVDDGVAQVERAEEPAATPAVSVEVTPEEPPADAPTPPPGDAPPPDEPVPEETIIIEGELPEEPPPSP
jgi:hypothetical protein